MEEHECRSSRILVKCTANLYEIMYNVRRTCLPYLILNTDSGVGKDLSHVCSILGKKEKKKF